MEKLKRCVQLIAVLENPDIEDGVLIKSVDDGWTAGRNALAMRGELFEENTNLIATDTANDRLAELERLMGLGD